jgi:hypothetical protein
MTARDSIDRNKLANGLYNVDISKINSIDWDKLANGLYNVDISKINLMRIRFFIRISGHSVRITYICLLPTFVCFKPKRQGNIA